MHNTLVFATFPLHSSVFYHSTERFVKFGAVLHHDINGLKQHHSRVPPVSLRVNAKVNAGGGGCPT